MKHTIETVKEHYPAVSQSTFNAIIKQFIQKMREDPILKGEFIVEAGKSGEYKESFSLPLDNSVFIFSSCFLAIILPNELDKKFIDLAFSFN